MAAADEVQGFAYGEHLEGVQRRSLGYRLLAPVAPEEWSGEVEGLARRLQAAPYPDAWPPVDLFCSVLLADGRRLVAVARYGLADHTPSHRRGGLELIGVVGPGHLPVAEALKGYGWLKQRRRQTEDLSQFGGAYKLADVLSAASASPTSAKPPAHRPERKADDAAGPAWDPVPVLPIRLWQEGVLLFAATAPSEPDHRLGLLGEGSGTAWQWLPLVGGDFPLQEYAQRGPVLAWTPHLAGVALQLDRRPSEEVRPTSPRTRWLAAGLAALLFVLLGANLWALSSLSRAVHEPNAPAAEPAQPSAAKNSPIAQRGHEPNEALATALARLLQRERALPEESPEEVEAAYRRLLDSDPDLQVGSVEGKKVVVAVSRLSRRSTERVEASIRKALAKKGYDPELIELACRQVRKQLDAGDREMP